MTDDPELLRYSRVFRHVADMLSEHARLLPEEDVTVPKSVFDSLEAAKGDLQPVLNKLAQLGTRAAHDRQAAEGWVKN